MLEPSGIKVHKMSSLHTVYWNRPEIIDKEKGLLRRKIKEALYMQGVEDLVSTPTIRLLTNWRMEDGSEEFLVLEDLD